MHCLFRCSMKAMSVSYQPSGRHPALVPSGTLDSGTASTGVIPSVSPMSNSNGFRNHACHFAWRKVYNRYSRIYRP